MMPRYPKFHEKYLSQSSNKIYQLTIDNKKTFYANVPLKKENKTCDSFLHTYRHCRR
jgi:hypothetical protein